jgi:hypothetical protein
VSSCLQIRLPRRATVAKLLHADLVLFTAAKAHSLAASGDGPMTKKRAPVPGISGTPHALAD